MYITFFFLFLASNTLLYMCILFSYTGTQKTNPFRYFARKREREGDIKYMNT